MESVPGQAGCLGVRVGGSRPVAKGSKSGPRSRNAPRYASRGAVVAFSIAATVLIAGVAAIALSTQQQSADQQSAEAGSTDAATWDLPALEGEGRVRLADFRGQPTVVNFFASWCTACDAELPDFRDAAAALGGAVNFVFVNSNEPGDWHPMAERNGILDFALAEDIGGSAGNGLYRSVGGTVGMPITAFYDAEGNLVDRVFGALTGGSLAVELERLYGIAL